MKYFTSMEASKVMGVSSRYVIRLCKEGKLDGAVKEGRIWKIPEASVNNHVNSNMKNNRKNMLSDNHGILPCGVGKSSYVELSQECYYVDKTLLIKDLLDTHSEVILFTRPRRFGKTLNMSMLQTFFEISDKDTSRYFVGKKIWLCGDEYRNRQGKYPVAFLTFKDVKYNDWNRTLEAMQYAIADEYKRHSELMDSTFLDESDFDYINRILTGKVSEVELGKSLYRLTDLLYKHYGKKVIVLIDEYDTPIQQGYSGNFYENVIEFMRNFFSGGLKDNQNLEFGVLTGILRISKENLFSGLNNPIVNTVVDEAFSEYFGFTCDEVTEIARYYGKSDKLSELAEWYNGYVFGNINIYNPWSVMNYFNNNCKPKTFWANTSENEILKYALSSMSPDDANELAELMSGKSMLTPLNMELIYPQVENDLGGLYSFLLVSGYLKLDAPIDETSYGTYAMVSIPNIEIRRVYESEVLAWIKTDTNATAIMNIKRALFTADGLLLKKSIQDFIIHSVSFFDASTEGFYHGMMLGLVAVMADQYSIKSNRELGLGRYNIALFPCNRKLPGIIMQFKSVADNSVDLDRLAKETLEQIDIKMYDIDMGDMNVKQVNRYGIAFCREKVSVFAE